MHSYRVVAILSHEHQPHNKPRSWKISICFQNCQIWLTLSWCNVALKPIFVLLLATKRSKNGTRAIEVLLAICSVIRVTSDVVSALNVDEFILYQSACCKNKVDNGCSFVTEELSTNLPEWHICLLNVWNSSNLSS